MAAPRGVQDLPVTNVRVDAQVAQAPDVTVEPRILLPSGVKIIQQRAAAAKAKALALSAQYSPDAQSLNATVAQAFQNLSSLSSPEMAKKTREIALLRKMLELKLTARDIEEALPLLKELKSVDKVAPIKPEQALDEEYERLLRARPGDALPSSSAEALRDAASGYRNRRQAIWDRMGERIGKDKAAGIRGMLRTEYTTFWSAPAGWQNLLTAPRPLSPLAPPVRSPRPPRVAPAPAPPASEPNLFLDRDATPSLFPGHPHVFGEPAQPSVDVDPNLFAPQETTEERRASTIDVGYRLQGPASANQVQTLTIITKEGRFQVTGQTVPQEDKAPEPQSDTAPATRTQSPSRRSSRSQSSSNTVIAAPGQAVTIGQDGARRLVFSYYGQASLDELIDLFERKLAAMRR
jgi:hypothetical protein